MHTLIRAVLVALLFSLIVAPVTFSQVICTPIGGSRNCGGPNGLSTTQVPLGRNQGVIITDHDTIPYTVLPSQPARGFDPAPLPSAPRYDRTYSTPSYGADMLIMPGTSSGNYGSYGSGYGYGSGLGMGE